MGHLVDNCLANVCQICIGACCSRITIISTSARTYSDMYI